jgi:putative spermidine/putrescine transport system permease protein
LTTTVTNPAIYALGSVTTLISFAVIGVALGTGAWLRRGRK